MTEYLTTRELATLLRIKERKVYDLAASGTVPCTKAHGKLLFPKGEVEAWIARNSTSASETPSPAQSDSGTSRRPDVVLGSHDPLLEWALRESNCGLPSFFDSSMDGLERYMARGGIASGLHLFSSADASWNVAAVQALNPSESVLLEWAHRQRGLLIAPDMGDRIQTVHDLQGRRVVMRQAGAGAQAVFEHVVGDAGLPDDAFEIVATVRTEVEAAQRVLDGSADAAFGLEAVARLHRLMFRPVIEERFDILFERRAYFEAPVQTLLAFTRTKAFRDKASALGGYDISALGRVHWNGA